MGWQTPRQGSISVGNLSMNFDNFRVEVGADPVDLTYLEAEVLKALLLNADRVIPYRELATALTYEGCPPKNRHLAVLIHRLRTKLTGSEPYAIETVRGRGYGLLRARRARFAAGRGVSQGSRLPSIRREGTPGKAEVSR